MNQKISILTTVHSYDIQDIALDFIFSSSFILTVVTVLFNGSLVTSLLELAWLDSLDTVPPPL